MCCFFNQKPAYVMLISDWSSDVCSSDLKELEFPTRAGKWAFDAEARAQLIRSLFGIGDDPDIDFGPIRTYGLLRLPPRHVMILADDTCPRPLACAKFWLQSGGERGRQAKRDHGRLAEIREQKIIVSERHLAGDLPFEPGCSGFG